MNDGRDEKAVPRSAESMYAELRNSTQSHFGVLDAKFLQQSIGLLLTEPPICVRENTSLHEVALLLKQHHIGCVLVVDESRRLVGIFGERDFITKLYDSGIDLRAAPVAEHMTKDPATATPDTHIAFALSLMSHMGFRHVPVVDENNVPIGIASVRDFVDHIVKTLSDDLLNLELPGL
jgi:CBS domain-containing protein